jgi:hypothetical protein
LREKADIIVRKKQNQSKNCGTREKDKKPIYHSWGLFRCRGSGKDRGGGPLPFSRFGESCGEQMEAI